MHGEGKRLTAPPPPRCPSPPRHHTIHQPTQGAEDRGRQKRRGPPRKAAGGAGEGRRAKRATPFVAAFSSGGCASPQDGGPKIRPATEARVRGLQGAPTGVQGSDGLPVGGPGPPGALLGISSEPEFEAPPPPRSVHPHQKKPKAPAGGAAPPTSHRGSLAAGGRGGFWFWGKSSGVGSRGGYAAGERKNKIATRPYVWGAAGPRATSVLRLYDCSGRSLRRCNGRRHAGELADGLGAKFEVLRREAGTGGRDITTTRNSQHVYMVVDGRRAFDTVAQQEDGASRWLRGSMNLHGG